MGFLDSLFTDKEEIINNNKEVYRKFLINYGQNPTHDYLKQLTLEAAQKYYASMRKNGKLTTEDEENIAKDMEKAVKEHERTKHEPGEEEELRKIYENFRKNESK